MRTTALLTLALTLSACENSVSPAGEHDMYFPNAVGSQWHYRTTFEYLHDTTFAVPGIDWSNTILSYTRKDTVSLSIVGQSSLDSAGGLAVQWEPSQRLDSLGFLYQRLWIKGGGRLQAGDTLAWYFRTTANRPAFYFVAPLTDSQEWQCHDCQSYFWEGHSVVRVERVPILLTPSGRFTNVFKFSHTFTGGDEYGGWISLYLVDRVGVVKLTQSTFEGGSPGGDIYTTLTLELEEYELK